MVVLNENIFQVLLTDSDLEPPLPEVMLRNVESFQSQHPTFKYHRLGNAEIEALIGANFDSDVLTAYRTLRPLCYRADLARFCLLLLYGGIYADMAIRLLRPVALPKGKQMMCFRDTPGTGLWTVSTSLIAASAGRNEFRIAIEMICKNVRERHYGANPLHPTGPALFGRALAIEDRIEDIDVGSFEVLADGRNAHNIGHVDSSGRIMSLRMKSGSFVDYGLAGTNDYPTLWNARQVYGEQGAYYPAAQSQFVTIGPTGARREPGGIEYTVETTGAFMFAPSQYLAAGDYRATYVFAPGSVLSGLAIDVLAGEGDHFEVLYQRPLSEPEGLRVTVEFSLKERAVFQIRLYSTGGATGLVLGLEVEPRASA